MQLEFHNLILNFKFFARNVTAVPMLTWWPLYYFNGAENHEVPTVAAMPQCTILPLQWTNAMRILQFNVWISIFMPSMWPQGLCGHFYFIFHWSWKPWSSYSSCHTKVHNVNEIGLEFRNLNFVFLQWTTKPMLTNTFLIQWSIKLCNLMFKFANNVTAVPMQSFWPNLEFQ